jgi:hypothetical protein
VIRCELGVCCNSLGTTEGGDLVDFRLRDRFSGPEEIEIAAFVGLAYMLRIERTITARVARSRLLPGGTAARELLVRDM